MYKLKISKTVNHNFNVMQTHLKFKKSLHLHKSLWNVYDNKLNNNITRAKSNIFNITQYNHFYYFFTQTISSVYDRKDVKSLVDKLNLVTRQLRVKHKDSQFYYLLIPEFHKDGKSIHLHGFLSDGFRHEAYKNKNGYLSLKCFDKLGFNSVSLIKKYDACCKYITKYITKDNFKNFSKGDRLFYCSQNLKRDNVVESGVITQIAPLHYSFKNEYVFKSTINESQYIKLISSINSSDGRVTYYSD